jgi:hypothetical protein
MNFDAIAGQVAGESWAAFRRTITAQRKTP